MEEKAMKKRFPFPPHLKNFSWPKFTILLWLFLLLVFFLSYGIKQQANPSAAQVVAPKLLHPMIEAALEENPPPMPLICSDPPYHFRCIQTQPGYFFCAASFGQAYEAQNENYHFEPLYASTLLFATTQNSPKVCCFADLIHYQGNVCITSDKTDLRLMLYGALKSLKAEDIKEVGALFSKIHKEGRLFDLKDKEFKTELLKNTPSLFILPDDKIAKLQSTGLSLNPYLPTYGAYEQTFGYLRHKDNPPLDISEATLSLHHLRPIGKKISPVFSEIDYAQAHPIQDLEAFSRTTRASTALLRRYIWKTHPINSANGYEHFSAYLFLIFLLLLWGARLYFKISHSNTKILLSLQVFILIAWIATRIIKYMATENLTRYLWYSYYFFLWISAQLFLMTAMEIAFENPRKKRIWQIRTASFAILASLVIMSNDMHQWIFVFPKGLLWGNDIYHHRPLYYILLSFLSLYFLMAIFFLLRFTKKARNTKYIFLAFSLYGFMLLYMYFYNTHHWLFRGFSMVQINCLFIMASWELIVRSHLIPHNNNYMRIFHQLEIPLYLVNLHFHPDTKNTALPLPDSLLTQLIRHKKNLNLSANGVIPLGTTSDRSPYLRYSAISIRGGYAIFETNHQSIQNMEHQLKKNNERLTYLTKALKHQENYHSEMVRISYRAQIQKKIQALLAKEMAQIQKNIGKLETTPALREAPQIFSEIKLRLSYCKQIGLLTLATQQGTTLSRAALSALFQNILEDKKMNPDRHAFFTLNIATEMAFSDVFLFYNFYYYVLLYLHHEPLDWVGSLNENALKISLNLSITWPEALSSPSIEKIHADIASKSTHPAVLSISWEEEENTLYIFLEKIK